ncbi:hypothetical protein FFLO_04291 [Filobasidium floriforme]|uniref:DUF1682-domain-containing protein n=1 Tax=Filobasidium floriforme TaxID=5210 RepID=A0A8K0JJ20_9TREE|nr:hypothetical protein FFLO_04291 [Filobasidium floriforme]
MALQPQTPSLDYTGLEYRWKNFVFRPAEFQKEAVFAGMLGLLMLVYFLGKKWNEQKARAWWSTFDPLYSSQFRAMSPLPNQPLVTNSPSTHLHYLTGRRNLLSLHTVLNLLPRHNAVQYIQDLVWGVVDPVNELGDELVLDYTLGENGKGQLGEGVGVWGVVRKSGVLTKIRKERWDVTFCKTVENPQIPPTHMLLTESADSTDYLLNAPNVGLLDVLKNERTGGLLKSLIITDQPTTRPTRGPLPESARSRHLIITLRLPPNGRYEETMPWVQVGLNLCDLMGKVAMKPETTRKLRKTRQEVSDELARSYAAEQKEENGDPEEEKKAAKRKEEAKRRAAMSDVERKKLELKEQKKQQRKAQIKQLKGGK